MKKPVDQIVIFLIIVIWISSSVLSVFYNAIKSVAEFKEWWNLSDTQRRYKIFGNVYDFTLFIKNNTEGKNVLLFSGDDMPYFLARYYLYPQLIFWDLDEKKVLSLAKTRKFTYIASFKKDIKLGGYKKISTLSSKKSGEYGFIYKKE